MHFLKGTKQNRQGDIVNKQAKMRLIVYFATQESQLANLWQNINNLLREKFMAAST